MTSYNSVRVGVASIYKQFHSELLNYIKSKIRSHDDAEDILQNVFIKISSNLDTLTEDNYNIILHAALTSVLIAFQTMIANAAPMIGATI